MESNSKHLAILNENFYSPTAQFFSIFSASKMGKTTFIKDFIVKKNFIYFSHFDMHHTMLYHTYMEQINRHFRLKHSSRFYDSFEKILSLIDEQSINEKLAIIIDDISALIKVDPLALNALVHIWEKSFINKPIMLIVLNNNLEHLGLLQKVSTSLFLDAFSFDNIINKPGLTPTDKFYIYSIFGASNHFLSYYSTKIDLQKNVLKLIFQPDSPFYNYGIEYLKKDFNDIGTFSTILFAIARKNHKIGSIAKLLGCPSTYLTRYIQKLQEKMLIRKELPLGKSTQFSKYGRYHINNNFLRFWFCYIYPNKAFLDMKRNTHILKELDENINQYILTPTYIDYIKEIIIQNPIKHLGYSPSKMGPWWDNDGHNIDLVTYNTSEITFIKIVWDSKDNATLHYAVLKENSDFFKTTLKKNYLIISKTTYFNSFT